MYRQRLQQLSSKLNSEDYLLQPQWSPERKHAATPSGNSNEQTGRAVSEVDQNEKQKLESAR